MKTKVASAVICALIAVSACDMNGVPNVEGTYTGTLTVQFVDAGVGVDGSMRMIVEQAGSNVTISGSVTFGGVTTGLTALSGTIDATGYFMATRSGLIDPDAALDTALCGRLHPTTGSLTFSSGEAQYAATAQTDFCGAISFHARLIR